MLHRRLLDFLLHHFGRDGFRRFLKNLRRGDNERVSLHLHKGFGLHRDAQISIAIALHLQALNRASRVTAERIVIGPVIGISRVRVGDVRHIHRLADVEDVLVRCVKPFPQERLSDITDIDEVVIRRADIEIYVDACVDRSAFINQLAPAARWQRRPADIIATRAPRNPGRSPFTTRHPEPAAVLQPDPASVVISGPTEIFVGDPGPADIGVGPIAIRVRPPTARARHARLPAIPVVAYFHPVPAGAEIIVEKINRHIGSRFRRPGAGESEDRDRHRKKYSFHKFDWVNGVRPAHAAKYSPRS